MQKILTEIRKNEKKSIYFVKYTSTIKFGVHFSLVNNLVLDYSAMTDYRRLLDRVNVYLSKMSEKFGNNIKLEKKCVHRVKLQD